MGSEETSAILATFTAKVKTESSGPHKCYSYNFLSKSFNFYEKFKYRVKAGKVIYQVKKEPAAKSEFSIRDPTALL